MKKCAIFFTLFVILLLIASITDKSNKVNHEMTTGSEEINYHDPLVNSSKVKNITEQE